MYIGVLKQEPTLEEELFKVEIDVNVPGNYINIITEKFSEYPDQYDSLQKAMWHVFENIRIHGSCHCVVSFCRDSQKRYMLRIEEPFGGFNPETITTPKRIGGGYKEFCRSQSEVGHSPDGKVTYLILE